MIGEPNAVLDRAERQPPQRNEQATGAGGARSWLRPRRLLVMPALAATVVLVIVLLVVFADQVAPYDPLEGDYSVVRHPPSAHHVLGTDDIGRDVLSRLIYG